MSNPYPGIRFVVDLPVVPQVEGNLSGNLGFKTITNGPLTNSRNTGKLHPDAYQNDPENGRTELSNRPSTLSVNVGGLTNLKHGDVVTFWGSKALEIRNNFAAGPWNNNQPTGGLGAILIETAYGSEVMNP